MVRAGVSSEALITSPPASKSGKDITDVVGLDKYAFNQLEASLSGPILFKKDSLGNKTKPLIGFFISGQYTNVVDGSPSYLGDIRVRPDGERRPCVANPAQLRSNIGGNDVILAYTSDFLRTVRHRDPEDPPECGPDQLPGLGQDRHHHHADHQLHPGWSPGLWQPPEL